MPQKDTNVNNNSLLSSNDEIVISDDKLAQIFEIGEEVLNISKAKLDAEEKRLTGIVDKNNPIQSSNFSNNTTQQKFTWDMYSLNGKSKAMRKQMLDDKYVLESMALMGQHTVLYASPNSGKTLITIHQLINAIHNNNFNPCDLMYVNADDTYKGIITKLELAEKYGFQMIAPGHNGFKAGYLTLMMKEFIKFSVANGKIIILDTLKKFTDLMDKKAGSEFGDISREFTSNGGTLISLAHVNKNKNSDGKSIKAGTSDISDDGDCVYIVDVISDSDEKVVEFRNDKDRGVVDKVVTFSFDSTEKNYLKLLDSVKRIDKNEATHMKKEADIKTFIYDNQQIIGFIKELIYGGTLSQKDILSNLHEFHGVSNRRARNILTKLTSSDPSDGCLWIYKPATEKNRYEYRLLNKYENQGGV